MIGILCEKPSAAKNFAKALGGMRGTYNGEQYKIAAAHGHLYEFAEPEKQVPKDLASQYRSWDIENLPWDERCFRWELIKKDGAASTLKVIKDTFKDCDEICCAGDLDDSGEGFIIQSRIFDELNLRPKKWSRMYFVDESVKEIRKAFTGRKVIPDIHKHDEFLKADFRSKWDFLSIQFTRVATKYGDGRSVLRQGRLKSAMVLIVGDGLKAYNDYKKIPFYQNRFRDENGNLFTSADEPMYPKKDDVPKIYTTSPVILDSKMMKSTAPPKLIDLATLSAMLAPKGLKANTVLKTYQKMYESQIVSYPRTDDKFISPEQFKDMLPNVDAIADLVGVDKSLLMHRTPRKTHVKTGGSHGANRPGPVVPKSLDNLKQFGPGAVEIYTILAHNYLAMLCEDYEYEQQKGHLQKYPQFTGTANVPKKMGYKLVFSDEDDTDIDESAAGLGTTAEPFVHEGFPPRPPHPTWKWLKTQLAKYDVGTGATRTSTYAEVTNDKAKYPLLVDTRGRITMTQYGEMSYQLLPGTHIGNLKITEELMGDMRDIGAGKLNPAVPLKAIQQMVVEDIETMKRNSVTMHANLGITGQPTVKEKYDGVWNGKQVSFGRTFSGYRFSDAECEALCRGEEIQIMGLKGQNGTYNVKGHLASQTFKGHQFVGFERTGYINSDGSDKSLSSSTNNGDYVVGKYCGKDVRIKRVWSRHTFTDDEIALLFAGKEISFETVSAKTGNPYTVKGKLATQTYQGRKFVGFKPDFK